jgi:carboxylate-amine ligase
MNGLRRIAVKFNSCLRHTVGVEWELQLLDVDTMDLFDGILPLMEFFPDTAFVKPEYIQSCVELTSCVSDTSTAAIEHIEETLTQTLQRCSELEMAVCGAGTHPFCRRLALITPTQRYRELEQRTGYLAHRQITFSAHVHIGMKSGDEAMRAMSHMIPTLPALIALSANSPFWRGHETGHAAYRHRILAASPSFGLPVAFRDWKHFEDFYRAAQKAAMIRTIKDVHWDIRPHPDFGTLEVRVMDSPSDLRTLLALVALARSMAVCMARLSRREVDRLVPLDLPWWIEKENCYRASHEGLAADFIYDEQGHCRPLRGLIEDLVDVCAQVAEEIGENAGLSLTENILADGPGYMKQTRVYDETHSAHAVTKELARRLLSLKACSHLPSFRAAPIAV